MKRIIVAVLCLASVSVFADVNPMLNTGVRELEWNFVLIDGDWALGAGYGQFVTDELLVSGLLEYNDAADIWSIGARLEYHVNLGTEAVPYGGVEIHLVDYDFDDMMLFGPKGGLKYFITDYMAIDVYARYLFSTEDWYDEEIEIRSGIRYLF